MRQAVIAVQVLGHLAVFAEQYWGAFRVNTDLAGRDL
jgi:hypothetical protein